MLKTGTRKDFLLNKEKIEKNPDVKQKLKINKKKEETKEKNTNDNMKK